MHSHEEHIFAAIKMAAQRGAKQIYLHAFLDGRDTPPRSAQASLEKADALFAELGVGATASLVGRYYAMDRDNRWERVSQAYGAMIKGEGQHTAANAGAAVEAAFPRSCC